MPPTASVDERSATPVVRVPPAAVTGAPVGKLAGPPRTRRRFWWLLAFTLALSALFYPPPWQALLRGVLVKLADQQGCDLTIGWMQGGPFDTVHLYDVRCQRRDSTGNHLRVAHAGLTFGWHIPGLQKSAPSATPSLALTGVSGQWDLNSPHAPSASNRAGSASGHWLQGIAARFTPKACFIQADDLSLQRGRYRLQARGLRLVGERNIPGRFLVREMAVSGPGFSNTLLNRRGQFLWQSTRITVTDVELAPGVNLLAASIDNTAAKPRQAAWECSLSVLGGSVRGQGIVDFSRPHLVLEVAGTLRRMPVAPLARLLGLLGPAAGQVERGSFSFRGDPENWPSAEMWLSAQATDFRWRQRDWQDLELRASVLHRRVQIRQLELRQSRNHLSLAGECSLVSFDQIATARWWENGFACNIDARLDDLNDLAQLFGNRLPALAGRMSVNGSLESMPDRAGIGGYLNVEGSRLSIRGVPLDYFRSTLIFRGGELHVADLQAARGADYLSGRGVLNLTGAIRYRGELHLAISDPSDYTPAFAGIRDLADPVRHWNLAPSPARQDSVFYGPDSDGNPVFLTFDRTLELPGAPASFLP